MNWQMTISTFAAGFLICASSSFARDRVVPGDHPTIQAGINAAIDGNLRVINSQVDMGVDTFNPGAEPFISLSSTSFDFTADEGGPNPPGQTLRVYNGGGGILKWEVIEDCPWLIVEPTRGTSGTEVSDVFLGVAVAGLRWGEYNCEIALVDPCAVNSPQRIEVNLHVVGPEMELSPKVFVFTAPQGGASPPDQSLSVIFRRGRGKRFSWHVSCDQPWLQPIPAGGVCSALQWQEVKLHVDTTGLLVGQYNCTVTIAEPSTQNSPQAVDVKLIIVGPIIELSRDEFRFFACSGAANPANQTLTIHNIGGGTLNWQILESCPWLQVNPNSGSCSTGGKSTVNVSADIAVLAPGRYDCELQICDRDLPNVVQKAVVTLLVGTERALLVPVEYSKIQQAVDAAEHGSAIIVAPGTYTGDGNYDIDFRGKSIVVRSLDPNDPNIVAATVIDCEQQGCGFYLDGCTGATISGLTITNGYAWHGGGIFCANSNITLSRCVVTKNRTRTQVTGPCNPNEAGRDGGDGGGIFASNSSVEILGCEITANQTADGACCKQKSPEFPGSYHPGDAGRGGGIACVNSSHLRVRDSNIANNSAGAGASDLHWEVEFGGDGGRGGGIFCDPSCSLTISHCVVSDNQTGKGGYGIVLSGYSRGGGVYCSSAIIEQSSFVDNSTAGGVAHMFSEGGAIYVEKGNVAISNCAFARNWSEDSCAGIRLDGDVAVVSDCTFIQNSVGEKGFDSGGGDAIGGGDNLTLRRSTFIDNGRDGWSSSVVSCGAGRLTVDHCIIADNHSTALILGGVANISHCLVKGNPDGIRCLFGNYTLSHCVIEANGSANKGAGISCFTDDTFVMTDCVIRGNASRHWGGGVILSGFTGKFTIRNCLITGNRSYGAGRGAGILCRKNANPIISNCTITGNWANEKGGGIYCDPPDVANFEGPTVLNSIVWGNMAPLGSQIALTTYSDPTTGTYFASSITVGYSLVEGGPEDVYVEPDSTLKWGEGNTSADPLFIRPGYWADVNDVDVVVEPNDPNAVWVIGDYHLSQTAAGQTQNSQFVDAGSDLAANLGMDRFTTRTDKIGDAGTVDVGFHYIEHIADLNDDGVINGQDTSILAYQWRQQHGEPSADIAPVHGDGLVDLRDLALLAENWLWPNK